MGYHAACLLGPVGQIKCIRQVYPIEQCLGHSTWKWNWKSLSRVQLFATPWTIPSVEFSRPEYWSGWLFLSPGDLPNPGIESRSPALQVDSLPSESQGKPKNTGVGSLSLLQWIFPTQELNQGLPHCRWILYQLSHKGSPRILEWVAYPFPRGSSWPRNRTGVSCIAGGFFTNWAVREAQRDGKSIQIDYIFVSMKLSGNRRNN